MGVLVQASRDLITFPTDLIVQQTNCVTRTAHGLSLTIAQAYPYANPYAKRQGKTPNIADANSRSQPGTVVIMTALQTNKLHNSTNNKNNEECDEKDDTHKAKEHQVNSGGLEGACVSTSRCAGDLAPSPSVACIMGQICPGKSSVWAARYGVLPSEDTSEKRFMYFQQGLAALRILIIENKYQRVSLPYQIGCGLGGGDWSRYAPVIALWVESLPENVTVTVCKLDK